MHTCCDRLKRALDHECDQHSDPFDCPDQLVAYAPRFDEFSLIIHDGGHSSVLIQYCPWCGSRLPESKRDRWFDELESQGIDAASDAIPERYQGDEWYQN